MKMVLGRVVVVALERREAVGRCVGMMALLADGVAEDPQVQAVSIVTVSAVDAGPVHAALQEGPVDADFAEAAW
jgi:hypothetical protein